MSTILLFCLSDPIIMHQEPKPPDSNSSHSAAETLVELRPLGLPMLRSRFLGSFLPGSRHITARINWAVAGLCQNSRLPDSPRATPLEALSLHCSWVSVDVFHWASSPPAPRVEREGNEALGGHPSQGEGGGGRAQCWQTD